jgi:glucose-6-phosphate 1-dehydrogenase
MLQVVANLVMEPPIGAGSEPLRDERVKIFRGIRPLGPGDVVRGQYRGYRGEDGVAPGSTVETYAAVRIHLDSWRWQGVPIVIRAGKRLPVTATEVLVALRPPPQNVFGESVPARANYLRFRLGPDKVAIALGARVKTPGAEMAGAATELFACDLRENRSDAYERLIADAMKGRHALFARQDGVEAAWRIVDPILDAELPVHLYDPGTWGPAEADRFVADYDGWHDPR